MVTKGAEDWASTLFKGAGKFNKQCEIHWAESWMPRPTRRSFLYQRFNSNKLLLPLQLAHQFQTDTSFWLPWGGTVCLLFVQTD